MVLRRRARLYPVPADRRLLQHSRRFLDSQQPVENRADVEAYFSRMEGFARAMDQEIEVTRHDTAQGVSAPGFALAKTLLQMNQLRAEKTGKLQSCDVGGAAGTGSAKKAFNGEWESEGGAHRGAKGLSGAGPARSPWWKEMQKRARPDAGVWALPKGADYYRASLAQWATTDKPPEEIHKLGLAIVADHSARLDALMKKQGMTKGSVGARLEGDVCRQALSLSQHRRGQGKADR